MYLLSLRLVFVGVFFGLMRDSLGDCEFECLGERNHNCRGQNCIDYMCSALCYNENLGETFSHEYKTENSRSVKYNKISINGSNTTELQPKIFTGYSDVKILTIVNTEIRTLLPGAFAGLDKITNLSLNNNCLENIKSGLFNSMKKLAYINLSFNDITYLDDHAFFNLNELQKIFLEHNKIASIDPKLFSWTKNVHYIDLSYNLITSKNASYICTHLSKEIKHLNLSNNQMEDVVFPNENCNNLRILDLSGNNIGEIGHNLTDLKELQILSLSTNKIRVLPIGCFSNLTKLQHLNLSHNEIDELQLGVFQDLTSVINMDLSHNNLKKLHEECFHVMKNLKYLKIDYNNIDDIDVHSFASGLNLSQVSLGNNRWRCSTLKTIIKNLEKMHIAIMVSSERKRKNVYGIFCEDGDDAGTTTKNTLLNNKNDEEMQFQKYLDDGFRKSTFYKYFGQFSENTNGGLAQKLVQDQKNLMDYAKHIFTLLIFQLLALTLIVLLLFYEKYQNYRRRKLNTNKNNDTSSGILMT